MRYQSFDPTPHGFPKPRVPVLPALSRASLTWRRQRKAMALTRAPSARFFTRGRYALRAAAALCGVGPKAPLLVPAYHCRTMLDGAISLGAQVLLYPVTWELRPDLDGLAARITQSHDKPAALLIPHYFGFAQDLTGLVELCSAHDVALIEDCAHCLFLPGEPGGVGMTGRYCISSPYKFLPIEDGGALWACQGEKLPTTKQARATVLQECKGLARGMQRTWRARQQARSLEEEARPTRSDSSAIAGSPARSLEQESRSTIAGAPPDGDDALPGTHRAQTSIREPAPFGDDDAKHDSDTTSPQYDESAETLRSLATSLRLIEHSDLDRLTTRRRSHFQEWLASIRALPNCRPLFTELPPGCVPYMFPLYLAKPERHFAPLKRAGVPVGRWDDMAVSDCAAATAYRTHLVHLPCHQELTKGQMDWMRETVCRILGDVQPSEAR